MAPPKKTKTMALDYEQQRLENIKRNKEIIVSVLHNKSQLASLLSPSKANKNKRTKKPDPPLTALRRSLRSRDLPRPDSTAMPAPTSPPSQQVPTGQFSFKDAFEDSASYQPLVEATCWPGERRALVDTKKKGQFEFGCESQSCA
jgi:hypothetical protein